MQFRGLGSKTRCSSHPGENFPSDIPVGHSGAIPWVVFYKNLLNCVPTFPVFTEKSRFSAAGSFAHAGGIKPKIFTRVTSVGSKFLTVWCSCEFIPGPSKSK